MLMKIITKVITSRINKVLPTIMSPIQGAFVEDKHMDHNIFLCKELLHKYGRLGMFPRCAIKIDIQKEYDTLRWGFIEEALKGFRFPIKFVDWIMTTMTIVSLL